MDDKRAKLTNVLVVDDEKSIHNLYRLILGAEYSVETASSGRKALEILPVLRPDIVLLDVSMADMDGFEVCRALRSNASLQFTKVIFVSGHSDLPDRLTGYDVGGDDYIVKPFDNDELRSKVRVMSRLKAVEEVDQIKDDLITLIGHETGTPINIIRNALGFLSENKSLERQEIETILKLVEKSVERLSEFAEKTILICKLKTKRVLSLERMDAKKLLFEVTHKLEQASNAGSIKMELETQVADISADPELIERALRYIIENSIKFSPRGGTVSITGQQINDKYVTRISDRGDGMSQERLTQVFSTFAIADIMHHSKGLGLSVALTSRIVELHNGTFNIESEIGGGTVCTVELPLYLS